MTEWEILKECKQAYELLLDLKENSQVESDNDRMNMEKCMNSLDNVYGFTWGMMSENIKESKLLMTDGFVRCPHCNSKLLISDLIGYAYLCPNCDENMYYTECEVEKVWWNE